MYNKMEGKDKKYIQKKAGNNFPAEELWYNKDTRGFMGFKKNKNSLIITRGILTDDNLANNTLNIFMKTIYNDIADEYIEEYLEGVRKDGYECFAISM